MNATHPLYTIGELARRTGLSVRTIRFYADAGVVPATDRSAAGYRLYDLDALTRLELVRTLRELGVDLDTIRRVLDRELTVPEVAARHADAVDVQIRTLRLRRAVLRAVAKGGTSEKEMRLMHKLTQLSEQERQRLVDDFLDDIFGGLEGDPQFEAKMRAARPTLPDDPSPAQVNAWVELAELIADPDFRGVVRRMTEQAAAARAAGEPQPDAAQAQALATATSEAVAPALADGVAPTSEAALPVLDRVVALHADSAGQRDTPAYRATLAERLDIFTDRRVNRYWQLLARINGWPWQERQDATFEAYEWLVAALAAHRGA